MPAPHPEDQRQFAVEVVRRLRAAGFAAYWAGGCVRDRLLGRVPKDYDVATDATPPQIRQVFGHRRTLAIGAAFGVITVVGPKAAGMVEVTTFRRDAAYSDGRHPDGVTFSSAEEDAQRRDFTINGLFFDPLAEEVIDFVGGQEDLRRGVIRAIGQAAERFAEDKLRMLRAVGGGGGGLIGGRCGSRPRFPSPSNRKPKRPWPKWPPKSASSAPSESPWRCGGCWSSRAACRPCGC
jgi:tRNA nucleotidyltransferase/poly(A) polymerase